MNCGPSFAASVQVCDLLDLLGDSEEALKPSSAAGPSVPGVTANMTVTAGSDLLDLLGGMDPVPLSPGLIHLYYIVPVNVVKMKLDLNRKGGKISLHFDELAINLLVYL